MSTLNDLGGEYLNFSLHQIKKKLIKVKNCKDSIFVNLLNFLGNGQKLLSLSI